VCPPGSAATGRLWLLLRNFRIRIPGEFHVALPRPPVGPASAKPPYRIVFRDCGVMTCAKVLCVEFLLLTPLLNNHTRGNGLVRRLIDEDQAARDAVLAVAVEAQRLGCLNPDPCDIVHLELIDA